MYILYDAAATSNGFKLKVGWLLSAGMLNVVEVLVMMMYVEYFEGLLEEM